MGLSPGSWSPTSWMMVWATAIWTGRSGHCSPAGTTHPGTHGGPEVGLGGGRVEEAGDEAVPRPDGVADPVLAQPRHRHLQPPRHLPVPAAVTWAGGGDTVMSLHLNENTQTGFSALVTMTYWSPSSSPIPPRSDCCPAPASAWARPCWRLRAKVVFLRCSASSCSPATVASQHCSSPRFPNMNLTVSRISSTDLRMYWVLELNTNRQSFHNRSCRSAGCGRRTPRTG